MDSIEGIWECCSCVEKLSWKLTEMLKKKINPMNAGTVISCHIHRGI